MTARTKDKHMQRIWLSLIETAQARGYQLKYGESEAEFLHRVIRAAPEHDAERMANLKARLQAKIAQKDSERGRPLTASEKLANLWQAISAEEQEPRR